MARKFTVIEPDGTRGMLKKSVALLLVRRQVAILVSPFTIRRIPLHQQPRNLPRAPRQRGTWRSDNYEHHIEPRLNRFTIADSEWLRYLHGWNR